MRGEFGTDPAFAELSQKIQQRQEALAGAERIKELLDKARGALAAGRVSEPAGNNAFDWFEQARQTDSGDADVNAFKATLAARISPTQGGAARRRRDCA